ncbi:hypothetical protein VIGAN_01000800 [Vigna angularis var. angularis]|uniref:Uncharacterized protein n=1 Tax=Vigna angularis var. angularis TaxID=157739 RepID=A0A0S3QW62_PHAAN|nr:hypothetical protein VIGAN_01000800 [Vigna angularis var. angularis]
MTSVVSVTEVVSQFHIFESRQLLLLPRTCFFFTFLLAAEPPLLPLTRLSSPWCLAGVPPPLLLPVLAHSGLVVGRASALHLRVTVGLPVFPPPLLLSLVRRRSPPLLLPVLSLAGASSATAASAGTASNAVSFFLSTLRLVDCIFADNNCCFLLIIIVVSGRESNCMYWLS